MSLEASTSSVDGVGTLTLVGEADGESAPRLSERIEVLTEAPLHELVVEMSGLTYLSSAGLRCLVFAHQRLGRQVRMVLVGTRPEVAETIRLTGFHRSVSMVDEVPR